MGARKKGGGQTPATVAAAKAGVAFTLHPYEVEHGVDDYGAKVADALGVARERLFKTLIAVVDEEPTVGMVPVCGALDLKALAAATGGKRARMAEAETAERLTGYVVGGISPLGQRRRLPAVLDESASGFDTIFVSAGRRGLQIELAPADLVRLTGAALAPIARR
ncbi:MULTISPECIES: Cys-tRNA(Pro) deacylase [Thermomonospora]|uniref:Cys-tRNA(Pro)/Cys-tRNA(Cys) deacylase n=1 Tax=Thermomonospora curvata (strain ATCC 19995 / DSM 43183 / JCM 3096 / KCTC 9072 / NBRC 15933 / NCIMB 10081 / Henssen B9) TaxID=471852 RepID=D1A7S2_THECD|nr:MULTISPECIES: Cys-tRNA(Pro) deacylase [Thermomonospora]ACY98444.1 ybaK/ebsC protein [Thermomonospora curvata DSM 43183]PKK13593.1 MAG: Cys-tRNA(Pro) deacylase [Thermomonospora sp. CIF 1]